MEELTSHNPPATSLVHEIAVSGHTLSALREKDRVWVSVRSVCASLSIDTSGQVRKLAKKTWAAMRTDFQHMAVDGKMRQMVLIDVECLPMWLGTIEAGRVSVELGDRLLVLQQRAAMAVKEHFFGTPSLPTATDKTIGERMTQNAAEAQAILADLSRSSPAIVPVPTARQHLVAQAEALVEQARAISSQRGEIAELRDIVLTMQSRQQLASTRLLEAPSAETPPEVPLRRWIDAMISELSVKIGKDHHETWRLVYRGLKLHYGIDAYARARNAGKVLKKEVQKIDVLASSGDLPKVYAVAKELVRQASAGAIKEGPAGVSEIKPLPEVKR